MSLYISKLDNDHVQSDDQNHITLSLHVHSNTVHFTGYALAIIYIVQLRVHATTNPLPWFIDNWVIYLSESHTLLQLKYNTRHSPLL